MPRHLRIEMAGAHYHVMARGDRREEIFLDDDDRRAFLRTLGEACERTGWRIHAWVLMSNHYHWLLETPEANLVEGMRWFQNTLTRRFNTRHRLWGHLFGGRYKAVLVETGREAQQMTPPQHLRGNYYLAVLDYIHLNPVRAGLVRVGEANGLLEFAWSSLRQGYAQSAEKRASWLEVAEGLHSAGCPDNARGRQQFVERLERRVAAEGAAQAGSPLEEGQSLQSTFKRGWYFGTQAFRDWVLEKAKEAGKALGRSGDSYEGARVQRGHGEGEAERLIQAGLQLLEVSEAELEKRARGDRRAGLIGGLVRRRTSVSLAWVAERLRLKTWANAAQAIGRAEAEAKTDATVGAQKKVLEVLS